MQCWICLSLCGDFQQTSAHESSVLSTKSEKDKRFPKPELEISFTPLKPDRLNVRRPGDDESVTVKIKRTARKRKSAEIKVCVRGHKIRKHIFHVHFSCSHYLPLIVYSCTLVLTCSGMYGFLFTRTQWSRRTERTSDLEETPGLIYNMWRYTCANMCVPMAA